MSSLAQLMASAPGHAAAAAASVAALRALEPLSNASTHPGAPSQLVQQQQTRGFSSRNRFSDDVDEKGGRPTTPWVRQVISGVDLMRHPKYNKGLAFSEAERDRLYLRGLLPPAVLSQEVQLERAILNIRSKEDPLDKYSYLQSLQGRNERLFYRCGGAGLLGLGRRLGGWGLRARSVVVKAAASSNSKKQAASSKHAKLQAASGKRQAASGKRQAASTPSFKLQAASSRQAAGKQQPAAAQACKPLAPPNHPPPRSVLLEHFEELLPIISNPTVRLACQRYGLMFKSLPRGLFVTLEDRVRSSE